MAKADLRDNVSRVKRTNVFGSTTFIGLRAADVLFQHALIHRGWASQLVRSLGGRALETGVIAQGPGGQLQPYYSIISAMAIGSSLKQIITILVVSEQEMPASSAVTIALFNTVFNSLNTILSIWSITSQNPSADSLASTLQTPLVGLAVGLYLSGILVEMVSELQRTWFKKNPANKGKPYAGGLFSLARHINYGGYTIWRAAYASVSGGMAWGAVVFTFFFSDFVRRGVPVLDKYLSERYGEQWKVVKSRVPYQLIPGVY